ncbi:AAA family ATPase [Shewanella sp. NIFS-20-20]|uniref:AAA family ATPase n=1 Tax=Shewanella sp. NIFS-20-20 TaxID=2853806 RepID=UPI001C456AFB|nr:AAA family ATPase [Shewanella sp. NIFS-20-20]MBV7315780.1 ATP-binding protein [Shewanella sp. NIFS-20-20]
MPLSAISPPLAATTAPRLAIIMRGLPGSGKSHWIEQFIESQPPHVATAIRRNGLCSTDSFFMRDGVYRFERSKLAEYHQRNLTQFIWALAKQQAIVICDNTNLAAWEYMAYDAAARALGYQVRCVLIGEPNDSAHQILCANRNRHGVSLGDIQRMARQFQAD